MKIDRVMRFMPDFPPVCEDLLVWKFLDLFTASDGRRLERRLRMQRGFLGADVMARNRIAWNPGTAPWLESRRCARERTRRRAWRGCFRSEDVGSAGNQEPTAVSGNQGRFVIEIGRRLKLCHERISVMGPMLLAEIEAQLRTKDEKGIQTIAVETAKLEFGNAELTREVAEIGVVEYEEGIFKQEELTASGIVAFSETELAAGARRRRDYQGELDQGQICVEGDCWGCRGDLLVRRQRTRGHRT